MHYLRVPENKPGSLSFTVEITADHLIILVRQLSGLHFWRMRVKAT
jgi:hypothetical protein